MGLIEKFIEFEKPTDETSKEVMTKSETKKEKHYIRTLGANPLVAAEAQRIYYPNLPPTKPKGPTAAQMEAGTSEALDTTGNWGQPEGKK